MSVMFKDEEQMRELLVRWLKDNGFITRKGLYVKSFEIDIAAIASAIITKGKVQQVKDNYVYAFETKIATTYKLIKEVVEQAIVRLLVADYVYVVVPKTAEGNGVKPMMDLTENIPDDLDYDWYINEAINKLADLGVNYELINT